MQDDNEGPSSESLQRFQRELDGLSSEEIQARLENRRIRSDDRRALAEEELRRRGVEVPTGAAREAAREDAAAQQAEGEDRATAAPSRDADADRARDAADSRETAGTAEAGVASAAARVRQWTRREDMPRARQVGRVLGVLAVVGGVVALVAGLVRR
jgi:hypothetical protein